MSSLCEQDLLSELVKEVRELRRILEASSLPPSELLEKSEVAAITGLGLSTLDRYRTCGFFGPCDIRIGKAYRWRRDEVLAWISRPTPSGELMNRADWREYWAEQQRRKK